MPKYSHVAGAAIGGQNNMQSAFAQADSLGYRALTEDPYLTGYYYVLFTRVPSFIETDITNQIFQVTQNAVTLPDVTLNSTEVVTGFGGAGKMNYATSVDVGTDFSIKFLETTGMPIINTIAQWQEAIRDTNTGLSTLKDYNLKSYSGEVLVILTKPQFVNGQYTVANNPRSFIEKAFFFDRAFPTNVPFSNLNQDIASSDKVEHDIPFKHSGFYHGELVNTFAATRLQSIMSMQNMLRMPVGSKA